MTVETAPWPDRRRTGPAVGDLVELRDVRYRITDLHPTDEGPLAKLMPIGGSSAFVMAHELRWDGAMWRPETEAELRESWGK